MSSTSGGTKPPDPTPASMNLPGQKSSPARNGTEVSGGATMRSFAQIIEQEKATRNILEIRTFNIKVNQMDHNQEVLPLMT